MLFLCRPLEAKIAEFIKANPHMATASARDIKEMLGIPQSVATVNIRRVINSKRGHDCHLHVFSLIFLVLHSLKAYRKRITAPRDLLAARHGRLPPHLARRLGLTAGAVLHPDEFAVEAAQKDADDDGHGGQAATHSVQKGTADDGGGQAAADGAGSNVSDSDSEVHRTFRAGDGADEAYDDHNDTDSDGAAAAGGTARAVAQNSHWRDSLAEEEDSY